MKIKKEKEQRIMEKEKTFEANSKGMAQFLKYTIIGVSAVGIDYLVMILFKEVFNIPVLTASAIGFMAALAFNYILSMKFVFVNFREGMTKTKAGIIFFITYLLGLGLNQLIMYVFTEKIIIHYMIAKLISITIVGLWNFFSKKVTIE